MDVMTANRSAAEGPSGRPSELLFTVTATFTAEPIEDALRFWMERLRLGRARLVFSAYNQVFAELMAPGGLLASSEPGVNLLLIRPEDWARDQDAGLRTRTVLAAEQEFLQALTAFSQRALRPTILLLCPPSQKASADLELAPVLQTIEASLRDTAKALRGVIVVSAKELADLYPVETVDDPESDRQGHIPFTQAYWAAMGTMLARKARTLLQPPHKAIVVDADNTLWGGIAAEVGAAGVQITGVWRQVQEFLLSRKEQGMLLALASKNKEEDVAEVFRRPDMTLRREDFVAWKVNWNPKSDSVRALASELDLGLDSFIFLDDNPVECAEVAAHCPSVTVLPLPQDEGALSFLRHVWAFDLPPVTSADSDRTEQYRRQGERKQSMAGSGSFSEFFERLDLRVEFVAVAPERVERAAQLTQRTNQFNTTGRRRTASELASLLVSGERQALLARVRDRFGDYGEVGLCVYSPSDRDLLVETFLLSCRVLGKGVEHQMLAALGRIAGELGKERVVVPFTQTERNEPAARFLEAVGGAFRQGDLFCFPAARASAVTFDPEQVRNMVPATFQESRDKGDIASAGCDFAEMAKLASVPEIQLAIRLKRLHSRPLLATEFVLPRNPAEGTLAEIWADALRLERVGIHDDFFALGGDSILAVQILSRANRAGLRLTLRQHFQFPTIAQLASITGLGKTDPRDAMGAAPRAPSRRYSLAKLGPKTLDQVMAHLAKTKG